MNSLTQIFKCFSLVLITFLLLSTANAQNDAVFKITADKKMSDVYDGVYNALEEARFYVVFEPNIGKNLAGFSERWGDEHNQNNLTGLRSMVFCNAWYANQVSNKDLDMLGMCPLHLTLYEREGKTTALFNRPTAFSADSSAGEVLQEIEDKVILAIKKGMK